MSVLEAAQTATPYNADENIRRGREAMKHVISSHAFEPHAMWRREIGWIAFYWGIPGHIPPKFETGKELKAWLKNQGKRFRPFQGGHGLSHIILKRNWEGKWFKPLLGQDGKKFALGIVETIARGKITDNGKIEIKDSNGNIAILARKNADGQEIFLLTAFKDVSAYSFDMILETVGDYGGKFPPLPSSLQFSLRPQTISTHLKSCGTRQQMGATDSTCNNITISFSKIKHKDSKMNVIFEQASKFDWRSALEDAKSLEDIEDIFSKFFGENYQIEEEAAFLDHAEKILEQIHDPKLKNLIDKGIRAELAKIKDKYARIAREEIIRDLEKAEILPSSDSCNTRIYLPGRKEALEAKYEILELNDIQASHNPDRNFERNSNYELENERQYHKEIASKSKVLNNASQLNPDFLLRDSVDANNGPSIIDQNNNVLGGNSRIMSIKLAYLNNVTTKFAENYRAELKKRAVELGIRTDIDKMKAPVLVRRIKGNYSKEERQKLVSALNDTFTDAKNSRMAGKSRGDRLSRAALEMIGQCMSEFETLRQFLDDASSRQVVEKLFQDGVIQAQEYNALIIADGMLNPYGKNVVEEALRGRLLKDYESLSRMSGTLISKLDNLAPFAAIAESIGGDWNMSEQITKALELTISYEAQKNEKGQKRGVKPFLEQIDILTQKTRLETHSAVEIKLFLLFALCNPTELRQRFRKFAKDATSLSKETNVMPGLEVTALQSATSNLLHLDLDEVSRQELAKKGLLKSGKRKKKENNNKNIILENAQPYNWRKALDEAATLKDIKDIFENFFGCKFSNDPEKYKNENSDYGIHKRGIKTREKLNEKCREILKRISDPAQLTGEDRAILLQYSGRGGLKDNSQWEYYTPVPVAQGIWDALKANGFENGNVLEPSCGAGVFLGTKPQGAVISANDIDETSSGVARLLNPDDFVSNMSFEEIAISAADDTFDSCVGNVPFGKARGKSMALDPVYSHEKQVERYFILRILDKIKPGGLACLVVPISVVGDKGAKWKAFRAAVSRKAEFLGAHKLPSGTFGAQGTDTVTDVIVLRKHGRSLLEKLQKDEIAADILRSANVLWDEFISGKYWQGEGRPYIMGRYVPKDVKDRFSREKVEGNIDDAAMRRNLAKKFHSRINWQLLDEAEPILRNYGEDDCKFINGQAYEWREGGWHKQDIPQNETQIDAALFGAANIDELKSALADTSGALSLNFEQVQAVLNAYPYLLNAQQKNAIKFAAMQIPELQEYAFHSAILGSMLRKMRVDEDAGEDVSSRRQTLQELITAQIEKYGHPANIARLKIDGASSGYGMYSASVDANGNFSDFLAGRQDHASAKGYKEDDLISIVSWLNKKNNGIVNLKDIQDLYRGSANISTLKDLAVFDEIAITTDGNIQLSVTALAGDGAAKIAEYQQAIEKESEKWLKEKFKRQIDQINAKIKRAKIEDVTFSFQQKWFSKQYILDFLRENGYPNAKYGEIQEVEVAGYAGYHTNKEFVEDVNNPNGQFFLRGYSPQSLSPFDKQFEKYLNGGVITSNKREYKEAYIKMAEELTEGFDTWIKQHPDSEELLEKYNMLFNSYIPVEYSEEPLGIDDILSGKIKPHTYQNAEVRRLSDQGTGICGFGTGLGKSFTALAMAGYNFKKGKTKRTCVVVPSAVLENWYHEASMFYSEAYMASNVFFVGLEPKIDRNGAKIRKAILDENGKPKEDTDGQPLMQDEISFTNSKEEIFDAMWKIPQANYSLVVMTKEKFQSIPVMPETLESYTTDMVKRGLMSETDAKKTAGSAEKKGTSYKEDVRANSISGNIAVMTAKKKKGELPFLEDMGFDSIITDESHFFKNSMSQSKDASRIRGVPSPAPSQIAIDMAMKCDYLRRQNNGRGVYGLTATPVTNSPVEIYNMLSLVCPKEEFESKGIYTVDDFIKVFGKVEEKDFLAASLDLARDMCLVGFQNLDALRSIFKRYVNIKTVEDVDDVIHVPNAENISENIDLNEIQSALYAKLKNDIRSLTKKATLPLTDREKEICASIEIMGEKSRGQQNNNEKRGVFSFLRDMDRITTDLDLYLRQMTFILPKEHKDSVELILDKLPREFTIKEWDEDAQAEVKNTYTFEPELAEKDDTIEIKIHENHEDAFINALQKANIDTAEINHPIFPKYAKLIENAKKHLDMNGKQIVFTEEKTQHAKLKRILVHNLPITDAQTALINADDASGDKLDKISKAYNAGEIKIVIANKKAEVGVNLQKGTTAIHHLTLPWMPASINQRNGRGVRQGNSAETVQIYYYNGKGTFDEYRQQMLVSKANWINDLMNGQSATVENADIEAQDEFLAALSGDLEDYKKKKAEAAKKRADANKVQKINQLKMLQSINASLKSYDDRYQTAREIAKEEIENCERLLEKYGASPERYGEDTVKKSRINLEKAKAKYAKLDDKFAQEKNKNEARKKQITSILRTAAKKGELPYDESLIDQPEKCMITLRGDIFCVGDFIQNKKDGVVFSVEEINEEYNYIYCLLDMEDGMRTRIQKADIAKNYCKLNMTKSEIWSNKFLSGKLPYHKLLDAGITKKMFFENIENISMDCYGGAFFENPDGSLKCSCNSLDGIPVWPEPQNAEWRKKALLAWGMTYLNLFNPPATSVMVSFFGKDYQEEVRKLLNEANIDPYLQEVCNDQWEKVAKKWLNFDDDDGSEMRSLIIKKAIKELHSNILDKTGTNPSDDELEQVNNFVNSKTKEARAKYLGANQETKEY